VAAQKRWEDGGRQARLPRPGYDAMASARRKVRVRAHVHSATDVMTILRLKDEFGFDLTLHHSTEAYKVATEVAKRGVSAVVLPLGSRIGVTDDAMKGPFELWKAGVKIAMHTDHPVINQKWLRLSAGLAMRYGLPEDEALKAITINVAGSRASRSRRAIVGKDADFVVMNGPCRTAHACGPRGGRWRRDLRSLDGGEVTMRETSRFLATTVVTAVAIAFVASPLAAQERAIAIRGGTVVPMDGPAITNATVVMRGGKITAVGANVTIPAGATVVDARGKYVLPGLIDAMTSLGIGSGDLNEPADPVSPQLRVFEAFNPFGDFGSGTSGPLRLHELLGGGVTTMYIAPADAALIGGQGAVVKTAGDNLAAMSLRDPAAIDPARRAAAQGRECEAARSAAHGRV
jgi:imidazolonepropionase-like amidohydrolase